MSTAPDTLVVTGPVNQQVSVDSLYITPQGGSQGLLSNFINGGTVVQTIPVGSILQSPTLAGIMLDSVTNNITASTTHSIAGAVALAASVNVISTVANASDAVKLPVATGGIGQAVTVFNNGASACAVYPGESGTVIDSHSAGAAATLTNGHSACFFQNTASTWVSQGSTAAAA